MFLSLKNTQKYLLALLCMSSLSACSVVMSLDGKDEPDLTVVKQNVSRSDIEMQLGDPITIEQKPNGQIVAVYEYEVGKEPSTGRAVAHGVMDVLTLGIWEAVGTPIEHFKGNMIHLTAIYTQDGRLISATKKVIE